MNSILLLGRIFFSIQFIFSAICFWSPETIEWGSTLEIPKAEILIPLIGIIGFLGGLSILLGYKARLGAWLIIVFLIPLTYLTTLFLERNDQIPAIAPLAAFMRHLALIGAALIIAYFGSGPFSIDNKHSDKKRRKL